MDPDNPRDDRFPPGFFEQAYTMTPGWEIGRPQPDLVALLDQHRLAEPILEVGCGSGALAISLGVRGYTVVGVDLVPKAIELADARLALQPSAVQPLVRFRVADAIQLQDLDPPFGTVIDSGFYHLFDESVREQFAERLRRCLKPEGRYYLLGFAVEGSYPNAPRQVTIDELRRRFSPERGWREIAAKAAGFLSTVRPEPIPATLACFERARDSGERT